MLSGNWNPPSYSTQDADEFIIADEDETSSQRIQPDVTENTPMSTSSHNANANANTNTNSMFSSFSFGPKVDLSSTFAPFTKSKAFTDSNTIKERQYSGGDTLDEPVWNTLKRDLSQIGRRLAIVVWPMQLASLAAKQQVRLIDFASNNGINLPQLIVNARRISVSENQNDDDEDRETGVTGDELLSQTTLEWDLWGPLIFSLAYSLTLGLSASKNETNLVFSGSFSFIWLFFIVIGLNIQLLGGNISFMSAISATGYSMFPITCGALICTLVVKMKLIRMVIMSILGAWSVYSGVMSLKCSGVLPGRILLAIYPVGLMYSVLSWLCIIT
ncbi:unnamed protein product [Debaryomyces tyrocola]|nr:unnamed protein product [Debaryomyces tyrocola]